MNVFELFPEDNNLASMIAKSSAVKEDAWHAGDNDWSSDQNQWSGGGGGAAPMVEADPDAPNPNRDRPPYANPDLEYDDDDWDEEESDLHNGAYVTDTQDPSGEVYRVSQYEPGARRCWIGDRDGRGWYISPDRLETCSDTQQIARYFGKSRDLDEFAPSPERDDNDDVPQQLVTLANRWWNAGDKQPQIENVLRSLGWSIHQVESEDDAVQLMNNDGTTYFISADEFDPEVFEQGVAKGNQLRDPWKEKHFGPGEVFDAPPATDQQRADQLAHDARAKDLTARLAKKFKDEMSTMKEADVGGQTFIVHFADMDTDETDTATVIAPDLHTARKIFSRENPELYIEMIRPAKTQFARHDFGEQGVAEGFFGDIKNNFAKGMQDKLKQAIPKEHHKHYDFDSLRSIDDTKKMLIKAKQAGHIVKEQDVAEQQVDELSSDTLKSYIKKSKGHSQKYDRLGDKADEKGDEELANKMWNKGDNRYAGDAQARNKIADKKGVAEGNDKDDAPYTPSPAKPFRNPAGFNKKGTGVGNKLADLNRKEMEKLQQKKQQGIAEGIMDVVKQTFNDNIAGWPMGTPSEQFVQGWARDIQARTGKRIPVEKLAQLYNNYTKRSGELMTSHGTTDESVAESGQGDDSTSPVGGNTNEHIVKVGNEYELKSKHGNKNLGKYPTKAGAEKRERQVQYFKHATESVDYAEKLQDERNSKINSLVNELSESIKGVK